MKNQEALFNKLSLLRQKAEKALIKIQHQESPSLNEFDALKLVHELEVHQIELELQNKDLIKALEDTEAAKALYEFAPSGYFTLDLESDIKALNLSAAKMLGKSRSELINRKFNAFVAQEDLSVYKCFLTSVFESESKQVAEIRLSIDGNPSLYVHIEGIVFNQSNQCLVTVIDITQKKAAVTALKESEAKFRGIFDQSPVGAALVSMEEKFVKCNLALCNFLGYTEDELLGKNFIEITHPEDSEIGKEGLKMLIDGVCTSVKHQKRYKHKNNEQLWGEVSISIVRDAGNYPLYFLPVILDITEQKKVENKLKESETLLKELNKTKDTFFNIIAHDLRNPFNSIIGLSEVLVEKIKDNDLIDIEKIGNIIYNSSSNAFNLLTNLLEWARIQAGRIEFRPEMIDVNTLFQKIVDLQIETAGQKSIKIELCIPENTSLFADKEMIATIVRNLVSNAIKFSFEGSEIVISADVKDSAFLLSVSDNGTGMSDETISRLFLIDEVNPLKGTKNEKGTGLGLILCKEFVEQHHGQIMVESTLEKGSTFIVRIPVKVQR